ncbi:MAG: hypothetical protein LAT61_03100 [Alcanivorax sp.]|nr:hypothetical protein [Alcanivorax sp.]
MTSAALICLVGTWPPSVLPMLKGPAAASSLTWTMELLEEPDDRAADTLWQYEVTTDQWSEAMVRAVRLFVIRKAAPLRSAARPSPYLPERLFLPFL